MFFSSFFIFIFIFLSVAGMASLNQYSYDLSGQETSRYFVHQGENGTEFFFVMRGISNSIAAIIFFRDKTYQSQIPVPPEFSIMNVTNPHKFYPERPATNTAFFIAWTDSYQVLYKQHPVITLRTQCQQEILVANESATTITAAKPFGK